MLPSLTLLDAVLSQEALDEVGVEYSLVDPVAEVGSLGSDSSIGG